MRIVPFVPSFHLPRPPERYVLYRRVATSYTAAGSTSLVLRQSKRLDVLARIEQTRMSFLFESTMDIILANANRINKLEKIGYHSVYFPSSVLLLARSRKLALQYSTS